MHKNCYSMQKAKLLNHYVITDSFLLDENASLD